MADEKVDSTKLEPEVQQQVDAAPFAGPAVYSNRVFLTISPHVARMSFVEMRAGDPIPMYRTAVVMGITELVALRDLLNRSLSDDNLETVAVRRVSDAERK